MLEEGWTMVGGGLEDVRGWLENGKGWANGWMIGR